VSTATFKGRTTGGTGNVEDLTATQATALLNTVTTSLKGLAPASGGGTTNFLRADGTWTAPPGTTNQTITLSGNVTGSGTTAITATIANDAVTYAKMQNVASNQRVLGRTSGAGGDVEELAASTVMDWVGSTRGSVLYRGSGGWAALTPNTVGFVLRDGGSGADPSWVGGMTLLNSGTASSAATLDITLPTGYRMYKLVLGPAFYPTTDAAVMGMRYSYDGGSTFQTTNYSWCILWTSTQAASAYGGFSNNDAGAWTSTGFCLGAYTQDSSSSALHCFEITIFQGDGSNNPRLLFNSSYLHSSGGYNTFSTGSGNHATLDVIDAVRILAHTGNVSGKWALYGVS
jgi:hypothetical protein